MTANTGATTKNSFPANINRNILRICYCSAGSRKLVIAESKSKRADGAGNTFLSLPINWRQREVGGSAGKSGAVAHPEVFVRISAISAPGNCFNRGAANRIFFLKRAIGFRLSRAFYRDSVLISRIDSISRRRGSAFALIGSWVSAVAGGEHRRRGEQKAEGRRLKDEGENQ